MTTTGSDILPPCIVTGVAGFIGSNLAEALLRCGQSVVGVDDLSWGTAEAMADFAGHPRFRFIQRSILEPGFAEDLAAVGGRGARLYHLAAVASTQYSLNHPQEAMRLNCDAALALHGAARTAGFATFLFAGSAAEYGDTPGSPLAEDAATDDTVQLSPYGVAKYRVSSHVRQSGFGVSLRFFNVYGPHQNPANPYSGVISKFLGAALAGRPLVVHGDGGQSRDFVYVDDVVEACLLATGIRDGVMRSGIYNIGTGISTTILDLARKVNGVTGNAAPVSFGPPCQGDIRESLSDPRAFMADTGWQPVVPLEKGLGLTIPWVMASGGGR